MTRVKICGLTRVEDALHASQTGADLLGFIFYPPSPRSVSRERCRAIAKALIAAGSTARRVGVFVNETPEKIRETLLACHLDYAQLSGDETAADLAALRDVAYKAIRPRGKRAAERLAAEFQNPGLTPSLLVDAYDPSLYGGTGRRAPDDAASAAGQDRTILLAGGLAPENVAGAVRTHHPWGVDVASGVERSPGVKDPGRVTAFIRAAKQAAQTARAKDRP